MISDLPEKILEGLHVKLNEEDKIRAGYYKYMSVTQTAIYTGLSERTIRSLIANNILRSATIGNRKILKRKTVDEYIEAHTN